MTMLKVSAKEEGEMRPTLDEFDHDLLGRLQEQFFPGGSGWWRFLSGPWMRLPAGVIFWYSESVVSPVVRGECKGSL